MLLIKGGPNPGITVNMDRCSFIRTSGRHVELCCDNNGDVFIAASCQTIEEATTVWQAITQAWVARDLVFDVYKWCAEHQIGII